MPAPKSFGEQYAYLRKGVAEIVPEEEFKAKLANSIKTGKPLRVKLGVDPSAPDIHLGHTVVLRKLKHFQDMGHTAIFLIGGFTALIGDPSGQSETRPALTPEQVEVNSKTYLEQVYKILDREKTEVRNNTEWLGKLSSYDVVQLCGKYRLARMLEREDFRSRLAANQPISVHELLYPLMQAYDSVALHADIELGATEQKFNLLIGREIQREYGVPSQVAFTMPILVGLDGERKMSKSLGNYVGITETPQQMFGKLMSVSDDQMWLYYDLLTDFTERVIVRLKDEVRTGVLPPIDAKMQLAHNIIAGFHGEEAAKKASDEFRRVFRERQAPSEMQEVKLAPGDYTLLKILTQHGLTESRSEAERLIKQGAVEWAGTISRDVNFPIQIPAASANGGEWVLRVGKKKFVRFTAA
jgi:tyrosyl-tRNA synthetase